MTCVEHCRKLIILAGLFMFVYCALFIAQSGLAAITGLPSVSSGVEDCVQRRAQYVQFQD
jgi:hypothetical protein